MALVEANVDRDRRRLAMRRTGGGGEGGRRERGGKNAKSKTGSNSNVSLTKKGPRPSSNYLIFPIFEEAPNVFRKIPHNRRKKNRSNPTTRSPPDH